MVRLRRLARDVERFACVVEALSKEGIRTGEQLLALTAGLEEQDMDLGSAVDAHAAAELVHFLESQCAAAPEPADQWLLRIKDSAVIVPTGSPAVDHLLGGGILSGELVELVGRTATGKTQLCLFATLHTVVHESCVVFVDTSNTFPAQRIADMYTAHLEQSEGYVPPEDDVAGTASPEEFLVQIMQCIEWKSAYNVHDLLHVLTQLYEDLESKASEFYENVRLIVIDSLAAVIAPVLGGRDGFVGHSIMTQVARLLKDIGMQQDVAIMVDLPLRVAAAVADTGAVYKLHCGRRWQGEACPRR